MLTAAHTSGDALYGDGASYYLRVPLELLPVPETLDDIWGQGTYARAQASGGQETILNLYFAEGAEPAAGILRSGKIDS